MTVNILPTQIHFLASEVNTFNAPTRQYFWSPPFAFQDKRSCQLLSNFENISKISNRHAVDVTSIMLLIMYSTFVVKKWMQQYVGTKIYRFILSFDFPVWQNLEPVETWDFCSATQVAHLDCSILWGVSVSSRLARFIIDTSAITKFKLNMS